ncbi:MAG: FimV family protein [Ketobacter sp.]|nr:FimV family protein [Ketobacter sp.]
MVRKLAAAMLGVGVLIPGLANALGLGEIKLNSALSEPLDAEIELVQVRELTATEILPSLAGSDDFQAAHVERFHFLTDLKFEVIVNAQGKSVIKIRSRKPVKEPFLNFLVEVNWPAGRLLREYTLLLDPPIYSAQPASPVKAPQTASTAPKPAAPVSTYEGVSQSQPSYSSGGYAEAAEGTHTISGNDSLWAIAKNMKPSDRVSIQQTMMAIQRINPDAFIDDNINLLKKGAVLRAPSEEEVMEMTNRDAIALAAEQNRRWRERVASKSGATEARQVDLSGRSVSREQDPSSGPATDRLKLVSGGSDSGDSGQGGSGQQGQLRDQLVVAEENVDKFKIENEELKLRMNDLEDQLDTSEKVLTLKDEQIAALQAKLRELEAAQQQAAQTESSIGSEPVEDTTSEPTVAEEPADEIKAGELIAPEETAEEVDYNFAEEPQDTSAEPVAEEPQDAMSQELAGVQVEDTAPVASTPAEPAVAPQPEQPKDDILSQIMANPMYLAAGGGAILLLIVLGLVAARRKQADASADEDFPEEFELPESQDNDSLMELDSVDLEEDDAFEEAVEASAVEETVPQTTDVIGEADIYIAYGRFPQAIEMLEKAAQNEPERADIRLKLCEVCAEAGEPEVFMNHYRVLQDIGTDADISRADSMRGKLGDIEDSSVADESPASDFDGDETLLAEGAAESFDFDEIDAASDEETSSLESELDLDSDTGLDFDLADLEDTGASFGADQADAAGEPQATSDVAGLDFDLNLNLDDETTDEGAAVSDDQPEAASDPAAMDFDLDTAFGEDVPSEPLTTPEPTDGESTLDEGALDFDADFSLDDVSNVETPDTDLSLDFEALDAESAPTPEANADESMDFDLDFDASTTELDETPSLDFSEDETVIQPPSDSEPELPLAEVPSQPESIQPDLQPESSSDDEPVLDSMSAAQLADELDFDLEADFPESKSEPADLNLDDDLDATVIASGLGAAPAAGAANDNDDSSEEMDFLSDADEASTKLDLARAYIDMGDRDGAKDILDEVMVEGNDNQKQEAKDLLTRLES